MNKLRAMFLLAGSILMLPALAQSQHSLSTACEIELVIANNEPAWNLSAVYVRKNNEDNNFTLRWRNGEQEVSVIVNEYQTPAEARVTPASLLTAAAREQRVLESTGDEAYLLGRVLTYETMVRYNVIFRIGRIRLNVEASSSESAQQFAKYLADALRAAEQLHAADRK